MYVLDEVAVLTEELDGKGLLFLLLSMAMEMNLNMEEAQAESGLAREEELASELRIPNSMLGFGVVEGAMRLGC